MCYNDSGNRAYGYASKVNVDFYLAHRREHASNTLPLSVRLRALISVT